MNLNRSVAANGGLRYDAFRGGIGDRGGGKRQNCREAKSQETQCRDPSRPLEFACLALHLAPLLDFAERSACGATVAHFVVYGMAIGTGLDEHRPVSSEAKKFGANLKRARLARGMTQEELGLAAGLDAAVVSRIETGVREPRVRNIVRLARALEVAPGVLFENV